MGSDRAPIPGGKRNEGPKINVKITRGYWLARTETTNELWSQVMGEELGEGVDPRKPVVGKTWDECKRFIDKLNENETFLRQFSPGESAAVFEASLPTEAQWERACRAGEEGEVTREIPAGIREVGTTDSDANPWGLLDMFGNAREWTLDYYEDYAASTASDLTDRAAWRDESAARVVRGAPASPTSRSAASPSPAARSASSPSPASSTPSPAPRPARAAQREGVLLDKAPSDVGFRVALVRKR